MVQAEGEVDLEQRLNQEWQTMLTQQSAAADFVSASQRKPFGGETGQVAFFNNKLVSCSLGRLDGDVTQPDSSSFQSLQDINRFFVDEGDSNDVPKVFFSQSNGAENGTGDADANQQPGGSDDLFEEALEDALCVFKSGGANTDLLKENAA